MTGTRIAGFRIDVSRLSVLFVLAALMLAPIRTSAQGLPLIRDTEIENTIRVYSAPLFRAADIDVSSVRIYLVNDPSLNAFVAGGMRIFVHTGLLTAAETPGQVIGVLAHEIGHIAGGHLSRIREAQRVATTQSIIASVLGGAAAAAAGRPEGIGAAVVGGAGIGQRSLLSHTRGMEQAADQAAVKYLDASGQSSKGLLEFMELLRTQEGGFSAGQDPYTRSHPLSEDRVRFIRNHLKSSRFANAKTPADLVAAHNRMRGKINGFLNDPRSTFNRYEADDPSVEAKYARSIAYMKLSETDNALAVIDPLIKQSPKDPFFRELRGDILRDAGRTREAMQAYKETVTILPWSALIRISLAQTQLELNDKKELDAVVVNLKEAIRYEPQIPRAWRQLATAYGRQKKQGLVSHALAEEAILKGDLRGADRLSKRAMRLLPQGSPEWLRAQDIEIEAKRLIKKRHG